MEEIGFLEKFYYFVLSICGWYFSGLFIKATYVILRDYVFPENFSGNDMLLELLCSVFWAIPAGLFMLLVVSLMQVVQGFPLTDGAKQLSCNLGIGAFVCTIVIPDIWYAWLSSKR